LALDASRADDEEDSTLLDTGLPDPGANKWSTGPEDTGESWSQNQHGWHRIDRVNLGNKAAGLVDDGEEDRRDGWSTGGVERREPWWYGGTGVVEKEERERSEEKKGRGEVEAGMECVATGNEKQIRLLERGRASCTWDGPVTYGTAT
jgi:hypothetical protein